MSIYTEELEPLNLAKQEQLGIQLQKPTAEQVEAALAGLSVSEMTDKISEAFQRVDDEIRKHYVRMSGIEGHASDLRFWASRYDEEKFMRQHALDLWLQRRHQLEMRGYEGNRQALKWLSEEGLNPELNRQAVDRAQEYQYGKISCRHTGKHTGIRMPVVRFPGVSSVSRTAGKLQY